MALDFRVAMTNSRLPFLREIPFVLSFSGEDTRQRVIALVTGVLVDWPFDLRHRERGGPRCRVPAGIIDGHLIVHRVGPEPREPLDDTPALGRAEAPGVP